MDDSRAKYVVPLRAHFDDSGNLVGASLASTRSADWTKPSGTDDVLIVGGTVYCEDSHAEQFWLRPQLLDATTSHFRTLTVSDLVTGEILETTAPNEDKWARLPAPAYGFAAAVPFSIKIVRRSDGRVLEGDPKFKLPRLSDSASKQSRSTDLTPPQWSTPEGSTGDPNGWDWSRALGDFTKPDPFDLPRVSKAIRALKTGSNGPFPTIRLLAERMVNELLAADPVAGWDKRDEDNPHGWRFSSHSTSKLKLDYQTLADAYHLKDASSGLYLRLDPALSDARLDAAAVATRFVVRPVDARFPNKWAMRAHQPDGTELLLDFARDGEPLGHGLAAVRPATTPGSDGGSAYQEWELKSEVITIDGTTTTVFTLWDDKTSPTGKVVGVTPENDAEPRLITPTEDGDGNPTDLRIRWVFEPTSP